MPLLEGRGGQGTLRVGDGVDEGRLPGAHDGERAVVRRLRRRGRGRQYFGVGHLSSPHKLAIFEDRFEGRKTWMELRDEYFGDYVEHCKEMENEVRRDYEK